MLVIKYEKNDLLLPAAMLNQQWVFLFLFVFVFLFVFSFVFVFVFVFAATCNCAEPTKGCQGFQAEQQG